MHRIFILSPANSAGERANLIFNPKAKFDLARRLQKGEPLPLAEIFSFLSGLYFRGKHTYSARFGAPPPGLHGAYIITSNSGLVPSTRQVTMDTLRSFAEVPIDPAEPRYVAPLKRDADDIARRSPPQCSIILLGSISTKKYAEILLESFGERLLFPECFIGRGDMSRGSLMLRSAADGNELRYIPVLGAVRRGKRPEKLPPRSWGIKNITKKNALAA